MRNKKCTNCKHIDDNFPCEWENRFIVSGCGGRKCKDYEEQDRTKPKPGGVEAARDPGENMKPSNPKDSLGVKKVPFHCIPCGPEFELGLAMMEGGRKYGAHNYRAVGVRASVYYDAMLRHVKAWWEGEDIDPDSGLPHLIKAAACLIVARDSILMDNFEDDRPIRYPKGINVEEFNKKAAELIEKYPKEAKPFLEKDKKGAKNA